MCVATTLRSTSAHARICKVPEGLLKAAPLPPPNIFGMYLRNAPLNLRYTHRDNPADYSHPQHKNQSQTKNKSPNNTISSAFEWLLQSRSHSKARLSHPYNLSHSLPFGILLPGSRSSAQPSSMWGGFPDRGKRRHLLAAAADSGALQA